MIRRVFLLASTVGLIAINACSSVSQSQLQTAAGETTPQPVVVQVPVEITAPELESGCWAQFYSERNFKGNLATLVGPSSLESADEMTGKQLREAIDSLVVGPKAALTVYKRAMFKDRSESFGPNSREAGLITKLGLGGEIQSLQLDCMP